MRKTLIIFFLISSNCFAGIKDSKKSIQEKTSEVKQLKQVESLFKRELKQNEIVKLKTICFKIGHPVVQILTKVMKDQAFPDQSRWQATFILGQLMGKKASSYIAKFAYHPEWIMRVASLKALTALNEKKYSKIFQEKLTDRSQIVRTQALDSISKLELTSLAPEVLKMIYDKSNYVETKNTLKRTQIIGQAIRTLGNLKYQKVAPVFANLMQKPHYRDLIDDFEYSLERITGRVSPDSSIKDRQKFWKTVL